MACALIDLAVGRLEVSVKVVQAALYACKPNALRNRLKLLSLLSIVHAQIGNENAALEALDTLSATIAQRQPHAFSEQQRTSTTKVVSPATTTASSSIIPYCTTVNVIGRTTTTIDASTTTTTTIDASNMPDTADASSSVSQLPQPPLLAAEEAVAVTQPSGPSDTKPTTCASWDLLHDWTAAMSLLALDNYSSKYWQVLEARIAAQYGVTGASFGCETSQEEATSSRVVSMRLRGILVACIVRLARGTIKGTSRDGSRSKLRLSSSSSSSIGSSSTRRCDCAGSGDDCCGAVRSDCPASYQKSKHYTNLAVGLATLLETPLPQRPVTALDAMQLAVTVEALLLAPGLLPEDRYACITRAGNILKLLRSHSRAFPFIRFWRLRLFKRHATLQSSLNKQIKRQM